MHRLLYFYLVYIFSFVGCNTQVSEIKINELDSLLKEWKQPDKPGFAVAIIKNSEIIFKQGYGMADLEHDVPITPHSVFYAGSVSKQFIAMCIMLLQEQGKLSIDDEIHSYFPELPDYGAPISIRQMIHHTSGLRDYLDLGFVGEIDWYDYVSDDEILELIMRQKKLNHKPGDKFSYCNTGYFLMAQIIKQLSGMSVKEFAEKNIFKPLNMNNSHFHDDPFHLIKNRAWSYEDGPDKSQRFIVWRFSAVGSGGLYITVEDMFKWDQNFFNNTLGKKDPKLIETMQTAGKLNNGQSTDNYAFAMFNETYRGLKLINHTGSMAGYRAYYARFPEQHFSVIILANTSSLNAKNAGRQIADIFLEDEMTQELLKTTKNKQTSKNDYSLSKEQLTPYLGHFYSEELPATYLINIHNNSIQLNAKSEMLNGKLLKPVAKDIFMLEDWLYLYFKRNKDTQEITGFQLEIKNGLNDVSFTRLPKI